MSPHPSSAPVPTTSSRRRSRRPPPALALLAATAAAAALAGAAPAARAATTTSSNWAGYAVTPRSVSATGRFRRVSGTWTVPAATCGEGTTASTAAWVGLGGLAASSDALEQIGTDADCDASGGASYSAWYELVPADSAPIRMTVRPGDVMSASVEVRGTTVRLRLRDATTGAAFARSLRMAAPDVSSADWIVEAPSECGGRGSCWTLPLGEFGTMSFTHAVAISTLGRRGVISSAAWRRTRIRLVEDDVRPGIARQAASTGATASALRSGGTAFSVTYEPGGSAS